MAYRYAVLWNCNYLLRFRFRLRKSSGFGSSPQFINKILLFNVRSSVVSQKIGLSFFLFSDFGVPFYVGSGSKPGSGTGNGMHYGSGPVPLTQKVAVSVPQHCRYVAYGFFFLFLTPLGESYFILKVV
jgi:hypothetical protein